MKKSKFKESKIIKALQENEAGRSVEEISRELDSISVLSSRVIGHLKELIEYFGKLKFIRTDNGPELVFQFNS